jgi:RNA polymerase sigma-B factor
VSSSDADRGAQREEAARLLADLHRLPADSPQRKPLRDRLAEMHLPLVEYLARRFTRRSVPLDDLVQVGSIGLLKAIDRFDPGRGLEFSTYAAPTILGEIKRYFRDTGWLIHVPRRAQELQTTLDSARAELSQELRRAPTVAELARRTGVDEDQVVEALDVARSYSGVPLDEITAPESGSGAAILADDDADLERVELREVLRPALAALSEREQHVLLLRFGAGKSQTEIAGIVGVSQMQVSRLISRSLTELRRRLAADDLGDVVP